MEKQVTSTPQIPGNGGGGGSGYLYLHYWPPVDREPAINVDMVNISECFSLLFGKLRPCNFLSFIVLWLLQPTTKYDFAIVEGYQEGNAKIKISIKKRWRRCHIRRPLTTVANRKCGPENEFLGTAVTSQP